MNQRENFARRFARSKSGMLGLIGVAIIVLAGLAAPLLARSPAGYSRDILLGPSAAHLLGTDNLGLDIGLEILWGARTSLYVSAVAVLISVGIGVPLGLVSGYSRSWVGETLDAAVDIFLTLPILPLMIIMAAIMGTSITNVALVIGLFSWPQLAKVCKNATLKISGMQYIEAAVCLGYSRGRILLHHVLRNITGPVLVNITLIMANSVLAESSLSFLGLGDPTAWSWGTILKRAWGNNAVINNPNPWWWWLAPSVCIIVFVVCFNMLGTAINDLLSPKTQA
ncbi:MAG: ABC transporter permease [Oscillospiraceae bacterium]|jgi:peptide/nickel transport system permease protein|nr:ABC transporter permease [Oscillospiraceae bacterium]